MVKILKYSSSGEEKKSARQNSLKSIFEWFNSQEKFTKFFVIFVLLFIIATPIIVSQYFDYRQFADVSAVPTQSPGDLDSDSDGFSDSVENFIGTSPNIKCIGTAGSGVPNSSWPPDLNNDRTVNTDDANVFKGPHFNKKSPHPAYNKRFDLNIDGQVNLSDVLKLSNFMDQSCQVSGGSDVHESLSEPVRAAFYYGWYPQQWADAGKRFTASLGAYDSGNSTVIDKHIDWMKYANIDGGIYSWWGANHHTNPRFRTYLDRAQAKGFKWGIYYELDWDTKRTIEQIRSDMTYIRDNYLSHPGYMYVNNKPAVFVYMPSVPVGVEGCAQVAKWTAIRNEFNLYVSLMEVDQWWTCNTLDSWHGYKPDQYAKGVGRGNTVYSLAISAGFWPAWEATPRLVRDFNKWQADIAGFNFYKPKWELVYFNEFGEGTNIEPSNARCLETDCLDYLKVLHDAP